MAREPSRETLSFLEDNEDYQLYTFRRCPSLLDNAMEREEWVDYQKFVVLNVVGI